MAFGVFELRQDRLARLPLAGLLAAAKGLDDLNGSGPGQTHHPQPSAAWRRGQSDDRVVGEDGVRQHVISA